METNSNTTTEPILAWDAPMHMHYERSARWYSTAGMVAVGIAAYAIVTGAWTFAIVILLCTAFAYLMRNEKPKSMHIALSMAGIAFEKEFFVWQYISGFWLIRTPGFTELHFEVISPRTKQYQILLPAGLDPAELRGLLQNFSPELRDRKEPILDMIIRLCKI
jgi:hypothetical protein